MELARVRGNVVASIKAAGLAAHKLLLVEPVSAQDPESAAGPAGLHCYVAIDLAGAGDGEVVIVARGSAARVAAGSAAAPTDAAIVAIVDSVACDGRTTFQKR